MLPTVINTHIPPTIQPIPSNLGAFGLPTFDVPTLPAFEMPSTRTLLLLGGAALLAWWYLYGFTSKRQAKAKAKLEYEKKLQQIEQEYSTGGRIRSAGRRAKKLVPKVSFS